MIRPVAQVDPFRNAAVTTSPPHDYFEFPYSKRMIYRPGVSPYTDSVQTARLLYAPCRVTH